MREVYRGSKSALNQNMRSFAACPSEASRAMVVMAAGWVKTDLGGPEAQLTIEESMPNLVNVLIAKQGRPGARVPGLTGQDGALVYALRKVRPSPDHALSG